MRVIAGLVLVLMAASYAAADIPPPPPRGGQKYVSVNNSVALARGVTGYRFFVEIGQGPGAPRLSYSAITLSEKPAAVPTGGRYKNVRLLAVPEEEAKSFPTEVGLTMALGKGIVPGVHGIGFSSSDMLPTTDRRGAVDWTYTIVAIDPKKGITARKERDGKPYDEGAGKPETKPAGREPSDGEPTASNFPATQYIIAGLFAAGAVVGLGLWLVTRRRAA